MRLPRPPVAGPTARLLRGLVAVVAVAVVLGSLLTGTASGHAFQVQHAPAQGSRLHGAPAELRLQFSEAVVGESVRLAARLASGAEVDVGRPQLEAGARVVRARLAPAGDAIYVVDWQVVAATDGHVTAGEYAFAVGDVEGAVSPSQQRGDAGGRVGVLARWLLFGGFALALGTFLAEPRLQAAASDRTLRFLARGGLSLAAAGAALVVALSPAAVPLAAPALWVLGAVAVAMLLAEASQRRWALAVTALALAAWSVRSHAAAYGGVVAAAVNFLHLSAGLAWAGLLAVVVVLLWRSRTDRDKQLGLVRAYAGPALWLVVAAAATGGASAAGLLTGVTDLAATNYGRTLSVKLALVGAAVGLALVARARGLLRTRVALLRGAVTSEVGVLAVALAVTAALTTIGPPVAGVAADSLLGPPPITGPTARAAGLAGNLNVQILAGDRQLQVEIFTPSGPAAGTEATVSARLPGGRRATLHPRPCGEGCLVQQFALPDGETQLRVMAAAPGWDGGQFVGTLSWPPPEPTPQRLRQVVTRMRQVPQLELTEQVSSGPGALGARTVTRLTGEQYVELAPYGAGEAVDVRPLPGEPAALEFALPGSRIVVTLWLDSDGRVTRELIVSPGHAIRREVRYPRS